MLSFLNPAETDQHYFEKGLFWTSLEIQTSVNEAEKGNRAIVSGLMWAATANAEVQIVHVLSGLLPRHGGNL